VDSSGVFPRPAPTERCLRESSTTAGVGWTTSRRSSFTPYLYRSSWAAFGFPQGTRVSIIVRAHDRAHSTGLPPFPQFGGCCVGIISLATSSPSTSIFLMHPCPMLHVLGGRLASELVSKSLKTVAGHSVPPQARIPAIISPTDSSIVRHTLQAASSLQNWGQRFSSNSGVYHRIVHCPPLPSICCRVAVSVPFPRRSVSITLSG